MNTRERRGEDTTKITSSPADVIFVVSSVFSSHEPVASCCGPFFLSGNLGDTNVTMGLRQSSEEEPSVDHHE